jgi:cytochrome d ubiquinol oxidase subunit I
MMEMLSRWQFGVTITYHFLFVPLTIGLALLVAVMQVLAYRRRDETWDRLARFFGTLFSSTSPWASLPASSRSSSSA